MPYSVPNNSCITRPTYLPKSTDERFASWKITNFIYSCWFQPIWKMFVKMGTFPILRGENKTYLKPPSYYLNHKTQLKVESPKVGTVSRSSICGHRRSLQSSVPCFFLGFLGVKLGRNFNLWPIVIWTSSIIESSHFTSKNQGQFSGERLLNGISGARQNSRKIRTVGDNPFRIGRFLWDRQSQPLPC